MLGRSSSQLPGYRGRSRIGRRSALTPLPAAHDNRLPRAGIHSHGAGDGPTGFTATYRTGVAAHRVALVTATGVTLVLSRAVPRQGIAV